MTPQIFVENFFIPLKARPKVVWDKVNRIGGESGWYFGTLLWKVRGSMDRLIGGIGFRKGRDRENRLVKGDQVDFWRVISVNDAEMQVKLKAEMLLPGEVCLEWKVGANTIHQRLEFKPLGSFGRLYWYLVRPLHYFIFFQMAKKIALG
ncbi:DUF2867 domain-containing protein [Cecembia sp.]|uniref:DUF2867 domain-containing protein n=1 Tax=Cecembia sp. TaxID=1898110 RepID=UPI0025BED2B8|nr:DUF2867 domain-containing protein [Cecembia sp.]